MIYFGAILYIVERLQYSTSKIDGWYCTFWVGTALRELLTGHLVVVVVVVELKLVSVQKLISSYRLLVQR
jgi:hypothetical protein